MKADRSSGKTTLEPPGGSRTCSTVNLDSSVEIVSHYLSEIAKWLCKFVYFFAICIFFCSIFTVFSLIFANFSIIFHFLVNFFHNCWWIMGIFLPMQWFACSLGTFQGHLQIYPLFRTLFSKLREKCTKFTFMSKKKNFKKILFFWTFFFVEN